MSSQKIPTAGLCGVFVLTITLILLPQAYSPSLREASQGSAVGAATFPRLYLWLLAFNGACLLLVDVKRLCRLKSCFNKVLCLRFAAVLAAFVVYYAAMAVLGYLISTLLMQAVLFRYVFHCKGWQWWLGAPLLLGAVYIFFFTSILGVTLPRGMGVAYSFNRWFY